MLPHQSQNGRCNLYKTPLFISSKILKKTKEKLNYCTIRQRQNTVVCEVDMSNATPQCWQKTWTNRRHFNRSVYALTNLCDTWHYRINRERLVMHRLQWIHIAILKERYKITDSAILDVWTWNKTYNEAECCKENDN
jgi:hypothetical protein